MFIYVGSLHAENKEKKIIYGDVFFNPLTSRGWVQYLNGGTLFLNLNAHRCFQTWKWLSELYAPRMHSKAAILTLVPSIEHYTDRESLIRSHLRCFHGQESKRILSTKKKKKEYKTGYQHGTSFIHSRLMDFTSDKENGGRTAWRGSKDGDCKERRAAGA